MIFWIEASQDIATGHLMESLSVASEMRKRGLSVQFLLNAYPPAEDILIKSDMKYAISSIEKGTETLNTIVPDNSERIIVINHRAVDFAHLDKLRKDGWKIAVIDQLGRQPVVCDVLINCSLIPEWLEYDFPSDRPECCFGPEYSFLREEFKSLHDREKKFPERNKKILVTMGGVDRTGATLRVVEALSRIGHDVKKEIIIGNGFVHMDRLEQIKMHLDGSFIFFQGVSNLGERMYHADLVFNAGGFTVYEMACVGVPGIILWEDPHEDLQGKAFAEKGTVINLGNGLMTDMNDILETTNSLLNNKDLRIKMSRNGKKIVDTNGIQRVCDKIIDLLPK